MALSMQRRLNKVSSQLDSNTKSSIRTTLAKLAHLMGKQYINVRDLNHKYHFILEQMGIAATFNHLRIRGELLADAHQLRLSRRTNYIVLVFTVSAFAVAALQIIQNELNKSSSIMDIIIHCSREPCCHCACESTHSPSCLQPFWVGCSKQTSKTYAFFAYSFTSFDNQIRGKVDISPFFDMAMSTCFQSFFEIEINSSDFISKMKT